LQFPLAHPTVDTVLLGANQLNHWADAVAMLQHTIPAAFWQKLKAEGLIPDNAPVPT
jgi:D-threo-aldose 1-dehydrogenase